MSCPLNPYRGTSHSSEREHFPPCCGEDIITMQLQQSTACQCTPVARISSLTRGGYQLLLRGTDYSLLWVSHHDGRCTLLGWGANMSGRVVNGTWDWRLAHS